MKQAIIAADEWARINLYQRQIGVQQGAPSTDAIQPLHYMSERLVRCIIAQNCKC